MALAIAEWSAVINFSLLNEAVGRNGIVPTGPECESKYFRISFDKLAEGIFAY
jgi:hypothetical protein